MNDNLCPNCQNSYTSGARFCPVCGKWLPLPSTSILQARYQIEKLLGQGGFGAVYLARDLRLKRECVVKQMTLEPGASPEEIAETQLNFEREAHALASLNKPGHPSIPEIYDFFTEANGHYLVMKFIAGESLEERQSKNSQPLPVNEVVYIGLQVASALEYMHTHKEGNRTAPVLHRDIKPGNILVDEQHRVWLVDFGLSKVQVSGGNKLRKTTALGTPGYAPSEQYGGQAEPRSDVYALAATLYHLRTNDDPGEHPFDFPKLDQLPEALKVALRPALSQTVSKRINAGEFYRLLEKHPVTGPLGYSQTVVSTHGTSSEKLHSHSHGVAFLKSLVNTGTVQNRWAQISLPKIKFSALSTQFPLWVKRAFIFVILGLVAVTLLPRLFTTPPTISYFVSDQSGNVEIYSVSSSGEKFQVTHSPGNSGSWGGEMTASGLYFTSNRDGKREIYRLSSQGVMERVTYSPGDSESWGAKSTVNGLYFTSTREDGKREIYRLTSTGVIERVTHSPGDSESWEPEGSLDGLYFTSNRDGKRDIYRLTSEGTTEQVTHSPGQTESWGAKVSENNSVYFTSTRDGTREVYLYTRTGKIEQVTNTPGYYESWAPQIDESGLLFTSTRDGKREVYRLAQDGDIQRITNTQINRESWTNTEEE